MVGETNLDKLLTSMSPQMNSQQYVFCCAGKRKLADFANAEPIASFTENEGLTLVLTVQQANQLGLEFEGIFRCISLKVHSSLHAVGLTAAISSQLARHQISANVIAAYYHDHVFVPDEDAEKALSLLHDMTT